MAHSDEIIQDITGLLRFKHIFPLLANCIIVVRAHHDHSSCSMMLLFHLSCFFWKQFRAVADILMGILPQAPSPVGAISLETKGNLLFTDFTTENILLASSLAGSSCTSRCLSGCWEDMCEPSFNHSSSLT